MMTLSLARKRVTKISAMRTLVISSGTVSIRGGRSSLQFSYCLYSFCTAAHMDRVSNHGSPGRMEDNPSWPSAGGNNFKCTPPQEVEEVSKPHEGTLSLDQTNLISLSLSLPRWVPSTSSPFRWVIWSPQRPRVACPPGSGPPVRIWRMCVLCSSRQHCICMCLTYR